MTFSGADWIILGIYLMFLAGVAFRLSRHSDDREESYLLDGRRLTLPSFVATTVSTWYGGILGVGEYSFKHGLSNWVVFGIPYYIAALIFAFFLAERARESRLLSIPDQLDAAYNGRVAMGGALYVFVMTVPAVYVLMMGILIQLFTGWNLLISTILAIVISSFYVLIGGFRSVVKTDWLQFSLMYLAFFVIVAKLFSLYGGLNFLAAKLPQEYFSWHGGASPWYVVSWYFIALAALVEPAFYQRCYAARSPGVAKRGLLISIVFWIIFDFLTTTTGMYARAVLGTGIRGVDAFPLLADRILPAGIKGLFIVGLMTTIMSTIDSYSFLAASTIGRDVFWKVKSIRQRAGQVGLTRWGLLFSAVLAVTIAMVAESVIDIWHRLGSLGTPGLLLPLALSYNRKWKFRAGWALANLCITPVIVGLWFIMRSLFEPPTFPWSIEPIFIGFMVSISILAMDHLARKG